MLKFRKLLIVLWVILIFKLPVCAFLAKSQKYNLVSAISDCGSDSSVSASFKTISSVAQSIIKNNNSFSDTIHAGIINTYYIKSIIKILECVNNQDTENIIVRGSAKYSKTGDSVTIYVNNILNSETLILTDDLLWSGGAALSLAENIIVVKIADRINRIAYDTIIVNYSPITFSIIQPLENSIIYDYTPNFLWNSNGDSYLILISMDSFANIYDSNIVTISKYHRANIPVNWYSYNNSYQWKVITYKNSYYSISPVYTFYIEELIGDFDNNNFVDDADLALLRIYWYSVPTNQNWDARYDIAPSTPTRIDYRDLALFSRYWYLGHQD